MTSKKYNQKLWFYLREGFMMSVIDMMIRLGIQIVLRLLLQKYEGLQCWYYLKGGGSYEVSR
jgi:hypothetical protein